MMREATALVWLAVHACEIQNGRASESVIVSNRVSCMTQQNFSYLI